MHVVINAIPLVSTLTGIGNCIYHTARALVDLDESNRYTFYYSYFSRKLICPDHPEAAPVDAPFGALHAAKGFLDRHPVVRAVARCGAEAWHHLAALPRRFDLYYEPNYIPLPLRARRCVVTVHDLSFHVHPDWHPADRVRYFTRRFFNRIERADVVTVDSEFTRDELLDAAKIDPARVHVVRLGCDHAIFHPRGDDEVLRFRAEHALPDRFVLFVGSIEPRKNLDRLLDAYARLPEQTRREYKLVLAGFAGWHNETTMRRVDAMKEHVRFLGYLDVDDLACCYSAATVFAYPSLYEGFGLPPLEALACRCPVLASDIPPLREVLGDAACFVPAESVDGISEGLANLLRDNGLRESLSARGLARARAFTWDRTAREMLGIFDDLAGRGA